MWVENSLIVGNSNSLELRGVRNAGTNKFLNTATAVVQLTDLAGNDVVGYNWPAVMDYVSGSLGCYKITLNDQLAITALQRYRAAWSVQGDGLTASGTIILQAKTRVN